MNILTSSVLVSLTSCNSARMSRLLGSLSSYKLRNITSKLKLHRGKNVEVLLKGKRVNAALILKWAKLPLAFQWLTAVAVGAWNLTGMKFFSMASSKKQNGTVSCRLVWYFTSQKRMNENKMLTLYKTIQTCKPHNFKLCYGKQLTFRWKETFK